MINTTGERGNARLLIYLLIRLKLALSSDPILVLLVDSGTSVAKRGDSYSDQRLPTLRQEMRNLVSLGAGRII